jgi:hypothetical protein
MRPVLVWAAFIFFIVCGGFIIAAQNSNGFGPFVVTPDIPREGRYVFAGIVQVLVFVWSIMIAFKALHSSSISFLRVVNFKQTPQLEGDVRSMDVGTLALGPSLLFVFGAFD